MSVIRNPYFWLPCILFWANQYLERIEGFYLPFLHSYLDDLLAIPVVLGITLQVFRVDISWKKPDGFYKNPGNHRRSVFRVFIRRIIAGMVPYLCS